MGECYSKVFIENGGVYDCSDFDISKVFEGLVIYEVIRIREGIPIFLNDHFQRLRNSAGLSDCELLIGFDELREQILQLTGISEISEGNIKVSFKYSESYTGYLIYFVDTHYPGPEMYENGVKGILYYAERRNPVVKEFNHKLRSSIYTELIQANAYEALLVNRNGCITEGSRSNIFFIKGDTIITAPDDCVLGGITRSKILAICREEEFNVDFRCLHAGELNSVDSVFLTGTSPNVLPFREIESCKFRADDTMLKSLADSYMKVVEDYMKDFVSK
ncbi:MAG: aminotransferase class IV [Bacteroidales bacterium]|nr:aminotransferase class IV [Bacteroidales bacterium]